MPLSLLRWSQRLLLTMPSSLIVPSPLRYWLGNHKTHQSGTGGSFNEAAAFTLWYGLESCLPCSGQDFYYRACSGRVTHKPKSVMTRWFIAIYHRRTLTGRTGSLFGLRSEGTKNKIKRIAVFMSSSPRSKSMALKFFLCFFKCPLIFSAASLAFTIAWVVLSAFCTHFGPGLARQKHCRRALHFKTCSYTSIKSILEKHLEHQPLEQELPLASPAHQNVRGGPYYNPTP